MGNFPFGPVNGSFIAQVGPSGDQTGAGDAARINGAFTTLNGSSGTILLQPGQWYLKPGAVVFSLANSQTVLIDGQWGARINAVAGGSGDVIRMVNPNTQSGGLFSYRSGVIRTTIDGTSASTGITGLRIGDIAGGQTDVTVTNFSATGQRGLVLENSVSWTEEGSYKALIYNCLAPATLLVSAGHVSFGYNDIDLQVINVTNQQAGVSLLNGALAYHGNLRIRGNFTAGASATTASVLNMSGVNASGGPANGAVCSMIRQRLEIMVECASGANAPKTINLDTVNFANIDGCYGILDFGVSPPNFTTSSPQLGQFGFNGIVAGDTSLAPSLHNDNNAGWFTVQQPRYYAFIAGSAGGFMAGGSADFSSLTLAANTTITLNEGNPTLGVPQRITFVLKQAAAGGPFTVTWPHAGSPTTANPTVLWAGGTAPTMSAGANAVDVYDLETIDGITWYGRATQNVS